MVIFHSYVKLPEGTWDPLKNIGILNPVEHSGTLNPDAPGYRYTKCEAQRYPPKPCPKRWSAKQNPTADDSLPLQHDLIVFVPDVQFVDVIFQYFSYLFMIVDRDQARILQRHLMKSQCASQIFDAARIIAVKFQIFLVRRKSNVLF